MPGHKLAGLSALSHPNGVVMVLIYVTWAAQDPQVSFFEQMSASAVAKSPLRSEAIRWRTFLRWPKGAPLAAVMFVSWVAAWYRCSLYDKLIATGDAGFSC